LTGGGVGVEVGQGVDLGCVVGGVGPVVETGVWACAALGVDVVDPGVAGFG
jgi:hypothetical protein